MDCAPAMTRIQNDCGFPLMGAYVSAMSSYSDFEARVVFSRDQETDSSRIFPGTRKARRLSQAPQRTM